jgi:hypothetical protein
MGFGKGEAGLGYFVPAVMQMIRVPYYRETVRRK